MCIGSLAVSILLCSKDFFLFLFLIITPIDANWILGYFDLCYAQRPSFSSSSYEFEAYWYEKHQMLILFKLSDEV
jgi:hypothetical protein